MFLFFSNNLGCAGSLLVSAVVTLVLLLLFGVIELNSGTFSPAAGIGEIDGVFNRGHRFLSTSRLS